MSRVREEKEQLKRQNNAPAWRDCNAAGLPHLWARAHEVDGHVYWHCQRGSCAVGTRTILGDRPKNRL